MKNGEFQITQKLFLLHEENFLVLRDKKSGLGDLPGGRMTEEEFFKNWEESLFREVQEELGSSLKCKFRPNPILIHKHRVNDENKPCLIIAYEGHIESGDIILSDEHDYFAWADIRSYNPEDIFTEYMLEAVKKYLNNKRLDLKYAP